MTGVDNEVVWITGASSGIGRAMAEAYLDRGAYLIVTARDEEALRAIGPEDRVRVVPADLTDEGARGEAVERALDWRGRVDVLVNNAGVSQRARALETDLETSRWIMELNFFAPVALTRAVVPGMVERGSGQIVAVGSMASYVPTPGRSTYGASKSALRTWCDSLRAELDETSVTVTVASPGYVSTGISKRAKTGDGSAKGTLEETDEQGIPPEQCAREIIEAADRGRLEVLPGGWETWAVYLKRFLPGVTAWMLPQFQPESD